MEEEKGGKVGERAGWKVEKEKVVGRGTREESSFGKRSTARIHKVPLDGQHLSTRSEVEVWRLVGPSIRCDLV